EPLIETPRERRAPDCVGMDVRLNGPGTTDGSGRFVCGGSVRSRGAKRVKGCMARIMRNYSTFRKRNHFSASTHEPARMLGAPQPLYFDPSGDCSRRYRG